METLDAPVLEKETENFIEGLKGQNAPPIYKLTPQEAREVLEKVQSQSVEQLQVDIDDRTIPGGPKGEISIRIIRPANNQEKLPILIYYHGAGWVMGSKDTHGRLMNELAVGNNTAVVFVDYSLSPEAKFPLAIEEAYAAAKYIFEKADELNLDSSRFAVAGDSVGGNMTIAVTLLAKARGGPRIDAQVLFYPVTSSDLNTNSYEQYVDGPWLTKPAMEWFWKAYEPDPAARNDPLISPIRASVDQLKGLPPALVITAENDVLRDEGEAYAHNLMLAGVDVTACRFLGTIHDFVMLNALAQTPAKRSALTLTNAFLNEKLNHAKNTF